MKAVQFKPCAWSSPRAFDPQQLQLPFVKSLHTLPARQATKKKTLFCYENYFIPDQKKDFQPHESMLSPPPTPSKMLLNQGVRQILLNLSSKAGLE